MMILNTENKKCKKKLFDLSIDEDYYKPRKTNDPFNSNYIEYESK